MQPEDPNQHRRELTLIYQIDRLRDSAHEEGALIGGITSLLTTEFSATFCMITLNQEEGDEPVIRSITDRQNLHPAQINQIRQLAHAIPFTDMLAFDEQPHFHLVAAPLILNSERFGTIVIGRELPFVLSDIQLLDAAITQIDSAIIHIHNVQQLRQRNRELELIYLIDRIRDQEHDLDNMLQRVLIELSGVVNSEIGFIALYDEAQETRLQLKVATDGAPLSTEHYDAIHRYAFQAIQTAQPLVINTGAIGARSLLALPLILRDKIIGVVGALDSKRPQGFHHDDRKLMSALTSQIDTAIFERKEQRRLRRLLQRAVDPKVLEHMIERTDVNLLTGERVELTALFADIRNSTAWAEQTTPDDLLTMLNAFYGRMTEIIFKHGGTLDKYAGDQVIALFGTPLLLPDHATRAARAAIEMQAQYRILQSDFATKQLNLPPLGIGIHSGMATAGEFGAQNRTEFTAIGPAINLCARLSGVAEGGTILISEATRTRLPADYATLALEPLMLKGIREPVTVHQLLHSSE